MAIAAELEDRHGVLAIEVASEQGQVATVLAGHHVDPRRLLSLDGPDEAESMADLVVGQIGEIARRSVTDRVGVERDQPHHRGRLRKASAGTDSAGGSRDAVRRKRVRYAHADPHP